MNTGKNLFEKGFSIQEEDINEKSDILEVKNLIFEENQLLDSSSDSSCTRYGCTCISHERCCGCILQ